MGDSPETGLRTAILQAAEALFIEQGYHGLSMRQIAEGVGVSKAALYYHFEDKQELFLAMLSAYLEAIGAVVDRARGEGGGARAQVRAVVRGILSLPARQRAVIRLANQEMTHLGPQAQAALRELYFARFWGKLQAILEAGMDAGELRRVDPALATWSLLGLMYPYLLPPGLGEAPAVELAIDPLVDIYLDGLGR